MKPKLFLSFLLALPCVSLRFNLSQRIVSGNSIDKSELNEAFHLSPTLFALADGLEGWALNGVRPELYAMKTIELIKEFEGLVPEFYKDLSTALHHADRLNDQPGGATVLLARLYPETNTLETLSVGNLVYIIFDEEGEGDAGVEALRGSRLRTEYISEPMLDGPFRPVHLGESGDNPSIASTRTHSLSKSKLILFASSGVALNMPEKELAETVERLWNVEGLRGPSLLDNVMEEVYHRSIETTGDTETNQKFYRETNHYRVGGFKGDLSIFFGRIEA